ncbi:monocarboxylate transporter 12-like [Diadema antillarum]|uniref:monocarboxylate transporter 12-like n=1 Tax=Diadema antillarum TaxID=105358 RepID=UPI003A8A9823
MECESSTSDDPGEANERSQDGGSNKTRKRRRTPDGGWAWVVVLGSMLIFVLRQGMSKCPGVFLPILCVEFDAGEAEVGTISSLFMTAGDFTGVGFGMAYVSSVAIIPQYFDKYYGIANGIAYSGSGLGIVIIPPLFQIFVDIYGWRGAFLLLGGLCLHSIVCAMLFKPFDENSEGNEKTSRTWRRRRNGKNGPAASSDEGEYLLQDGDLPTVLILLAQFAGRFAFIGWLIFLIPHVIEKGFEPLDATFVASAGGISLMVLQFTHGFVIDKKWLTPNQLLMIMSTLMATALLLDPLCTTYGTLIAGSVMVGAGTGVFFPASLATLCLAVGRERFPAANPKQLIEALFEQPSWKRVQTARFRSR